MRIGHGYDVHRIDGNRKLILCGVQIPCSFGLLGHSDADVAVHALMDALLGAAALGDIGGLFPDSDDQYKNANSMHLLDQVYRLIRRNNLEIVNIDLTILAQAPRLSPFVPSMRENLANAFNIPLQNISVKATTEEGLGFTGNRTGIAAHCVLLLNERSEGNY